MIDYGSGWSSRPWQVGFLYRYEVRAPRGKLSSDKCSSSIFFSVVVSNMFFFMFTPIWGRFPCWRIFFSNGWFNHQPVFVCTSEMGKRKFGGGNFRWLDALVMSFLGTPSCHASWRNVYDARGASSAPTSYIWTYKPYKWPYTWVISIN